MLISPTNLIIFRVKILLNFAHADEASRANFHENKRIIYRLPFMKKVYAPSLYFLTNSCEVVFRKWTWSFPHNGELMQQDG